MNADTMFSRTSVECPLGDFFGASFAKPRRFVADRLTISGGGYLCSFEMPFRQRAQITVENQATKRLRLFVFQVGYSQFTVDRPLAETVVVHWNSPTDLTR